MSRLATAASRRGDRAIREARPTGSQSAAQLARRILNEKIVIKENGQRRTITRREAMRIELVPVKPVYRLVDNSELGTERPNER